MARKTKGKREYLFTWSTKSFYSRPAGDNTFKKNRRIKESSLTKAQKKKIISNAGTWTRV